MIIGGKQQLSNKKLNIGLDRCRFVLSSIAIDGRVYRMNVERGEKAEIIDITTGEIIGISDFNLTIKGISLSDTDDYRIKVTLMKKPSVAFILDVNIPKLLYNSNERNASNLQHLSEVNQIIEKKLGEHGVYTDMSKAKLSSIEVNVNSADPKLYDAMKLIKKGFNTTNDKVFTTESNNNIESLMVKNTYLKLKVYNKAKQLADTNQIYDNENLIRLEISTNHKKTLETITVLNPTLDGIIEHWDKLEKWFIDVVKKQVKKPTDEFNKSVVNTMVEQLKQGHKTYDILALQCEQGNLVDMDLFAQAMKQYYKETGKKSPSTVIRNTKARYEKINKQQYDTLVGNIEALNNLWEQLGL